MDTIISRRGDLSTAWLAANYDKKLSKQQLLNTNVPKLTGIITEDINHDHIPLRYSGTLLLGVTKIYSRQTKYVQDVANDIELKSRYRVNLKISNVNLKSNDTIINLNNNTLKDQISKFDLLYQPELNFDDIANMFGNSNNDNDNLIEDSNDSTEFDTSIEMGRGVEEATLPEEPTVDIDLFGDDQDIEIGRDAVDLPAEDHTEFDIDLGQPLETIDELDEPVIAVPKVKRTGISEDGELITNKRKLKIDDVLDIPIAKLRDYQAALLSKENSHQLSTAQKLQIIYSEGINDVFKKRKLDVHLPVQIPSPEPETGDYHDASMDFNDYDVDFDLSLPEIQPQTPLEDDFLQSSQENVQSTKQIADQLKQLYNENAVTDLSTLIESDLKITSDFPDKVPLGSTQSNGINQKKEAAKCFFELLVLATNDCIHLNQPAAPTEIGSEISITGRDKLYSF